MNRTEKIAIDRIDTAVRVIASLTPSNPADVAAISRNLRHAVGGAKAIRQAITALRAQDWPEFEDRMDEADRALAEAPSVDGGKADG